MSNLAYLCCSDIPGLYPSRKAAYSVERNTVACDVDVVPLLWLALFRSTDLRTASVAIDGQRVNAHAPVTTVDAAFVNLRRSVGAFEALVAQPGAFAAHAELLARAIQIIGGKHVTIELEEIEALHDKRQFRGWLRRILSFLDEPREELELAMEMQRKDDLQSEPEKIAALRDRFPGQSLTAVREALRAAGGSVASAMRRFDASRTELERRQAANDVRPPARPPNNLVDCMITLTNVTVGGTYPPPQEVWRSGDPAQAVALCRLLGTRQERPVPWEPAVRET